MGLASRKFMPKNLLGGGKLAKTKDGKERMAPGPKGGLGKLVDLPPEVPPGLTHAAEVANYGVLRAALLSSAVCSISHTESLEQGARLKTQIERFRSLVAGLKSPVVSPAKGAPYISPLIKQLNLLEASYRATLGALCLTPKALAALRVSAGERLRTPAEPAPALKDPKKTAAKARVLKMFKVRSGSTVAS